MIDDSTIRYEYDCVLSGESPGYMQLFSPESRKRTSAAKQHLQSKDVDMLMSGRISENAAADMIANGSVSPSEKIFRRERSEDEKIALKVIRYAIEYYLGWTPEEAYQNFDLNIVALMKLDLAMQNINFPEECFSGGDCAYVISLLYPEFIYDSDASVIREYERSMNGTTHLPRNFYTDLYGKVRAKTVLRYILSEKLLGVQPADLFDLFYRRKAKKFLAKYHLTEPCVEHFDGIPVKYLYEVLPEETRRAYKPLYDKMMSNIEKSREQDLAERG